MFRGQRIQVWCLRLFACLAILGIFSTSAQAQTTIQVGGFNVQYWDPADGPAYAINTTYAAADLSLFSAAEIADMDNAFLYWTNVLNLSAADPDSPIIRMINNTAVPFFNANALSANTGGNHNVIDRLLGATPARDMGIDGRGVFFPNGIGFDTGSTMTQFSNAAFSMEMIAIHELGHMLGVATYDHAPFLADVTTIGFQDFYQGANALAVYGGSGIPLAGDGGHTDIPYENITRGLVMGQDFRNIPHASPAELAILADLGFGVVLSDNFGRAYYQDNTTMTDATAYSPGNKFGIGLYLNASNLNVTQNGNLTANGFAGTGIRLVGGSGNMVTVGSSTVISANGTNGIGILASGGELHDIVVRGTVGATGTNGRGILLDFGNTFLFTTITSEDYGNALVNSLDITGTVTGETDAIVIADTAGLNELNIMQGTTINGNIVSNALVSPGDNLFRPLMTFGRTADGNGQATNTPDNAFNFTYTDNITGNTLMDADFVGGTTNLNGVSNFAFSQIMDGATLTTTNSVGSTTLNVLGGGTLIDNGVVSANTLNIMQNGRVQGTGLISSTSTIHNSGTIAPGNSIGTLNFNASIQNDANSVLEIEVQPAAIPIPGVDNDFLNINGNLIFDGGTVNILGLPPNGAYTVGSTYTYALTTGDVIVNTAPALTDDLLDLRAIGLYGPNTAAFILAFDGSYAGIARTYNQRNFGNYLDIAKLDLFNTNIQTLRNNIDTLPTIPDMLTAIDQLTGEAYGTMAISQMQNLSSLFVNISDQVHHHHEPGVPCLDEIWYAGYGNIGHTMFDGNVSEADPTASGHMFGKSWCAGNDTATGIFYNYERQNLRSDRVRTKVESDSHRIGMYLRNQAGMYHTLIAAFGGWDKNEGQRVVNVNTINEFNQSAYQSWNAGLYVEQGMTYGVEFLGVQPYTSLQILHSSSDGFVEQGGPLTSLAVNGIDVDSFRLMAGSRIKMLNHAAGIRLGVDSSIAFEAADNVADYQASLLSTPGLAFQARGVDLGQVFFTLGPTLDWRWGYVDMFLNYRATIGRESSIHTGQGGAEVVW